MDESHRLKHMPQGYDKDLFNQIYKETRDLRHKLAFEIDSRKFGVDYKEVLSWFDVKFIYAFTRYYGDERLKGYIINALRTFKMRIIKNSYQNKYTIHNSIDISEVFDLSMEEEDTSQEGLLDQVKSYFKKRLSHEAYMIWDLELNPPPYILTRLPESKNGTLKKCPDDLLLDYLGLSEHPKAQQMLLGWRREIKDITLLAKDHFQFHVYNL